MAKEICLSLDMSTISVVDNNGTMTSMSLDKNGVVVSNVNGSINIAPAGNSDNGTPTLLPVQDSLWQVSYDDGAETFYIIGVIDIDSSKTPEQHNFVLQNQEVHFRRDGDTLVLQYSSN